MAGIIDYARRNGSKTFKESEFNEVDALILATLSYVDFDGILESDSKFKVKIEDAAKKFLKKYNKKQISNNLLGVKAAINLLEVIKDYPRYSDLELYNYVYKADNVEQFSAVFIDIDENTTYVSFEGTDDLVSGWREDAELSYRFPVAAQKDAIAYINKNISIFSNKKYIIGGHSKGGNLSLVASMYANPLIRKKIKLIYSFDGPGLRKKQLESYHYKKIRNQYIHVIPNNSIIGLLLRHEKHQVILSNKKGLMAHNIATWQVEDNHFISSKLSLSSESLNKKLKKWLDRYTDDMRKEFVCDLFMVFERAKIETLLDIKNSTITNVIKILKESTKINKESKKMIKDLIEFVIKVK